MPTDHRTALANIKRFDQLIAYLRDEMGWPIARDSFEDVDDLFYDFTAEELGIDPKTAAKIESIKRLRPLSPRQPWGIFFVKFEPKKLPVVALRRILSQVALKKRASANSAERTAWAADDLLFVSNYGEGEERQISFAHFSQAETKHDLPTLKVLGWDNRDTTLHLDAVAKELTQHLAWPDDDADVEAWRKSWRGAFTLRHLETVTTSKELSIRLAELARAIRDRIKTALAIETDKGPLTRLMKAFQEALVHDLDADGFADMYAQTIAYGLLSARIADPHKKTADDFAAHMRTNPFLRELMETFLKVGGRRGKAGGPGIDFDELGVSEVVDLLDDANMEAVVRDFGDRNPQEDPVIHFYESFLSAYNKQLKIQRGVFYTPQPVVSYIVRSVHELLQTEFGLADGLADTTTWGEMLQKHPGLKLPPLTDGPNEARTISPDEPFVQILDPATGTATFLVEVIDIIHRTLAAKWKQQRLTDVQQRATWNAYVPQHLLPRLHAFELMMAPYAIAHMKIGLKLAETGYRFGTEERARIYLTNALEPWMKQLPLIGFDALAHEAKEVNEIKRDKRFTVVIGNPPYSIFSANHNDYIDSLMSLYKNSVRGERNIQPLSDDYIKFICFAQRINHISGAGVVGMITNHGYLSGLIHRGIREELLKHFNRISVIDLHGNSVNRETPPVGVTDENVFDIKQGVSIAILSRTIGGIGASALTHRDFWGDRRYKYQSLLQASGGESTQLRPTAPNFFFVTKNFAHLSESTDSWGCDKVFQVMTSGVKTHRDELVINFDLEQLEAKISDARRGKFPHSLVTESALASLKEDSKWRKSFLQYLYRPFDIRFIFYHESLIERSRRNVMQHLLSDNLSLCTMRQVVGDPFHHVLAARLITDMNILASHHVSQVTIPLYLYEAEDGSCQQHLLGHLARRPNFTSDFLRAFASKLKVRQLGQFGLPEEITPEDIFHYAYAVFHSPGYRSRYAEFLKIDFPRLPLTGNLELFRALARLGGELTALHLLESPKLDQPIAEFNGGRNPEIEKVSWSKNTVWVDKAQSMGFRSVPEAVWNFHIGGYQVCHKWLDDRRKAGRTLSKDDIAHYQKIVVALDETIRLMKEIDEVIEKHGGWPGAFSAGGAGQSSSKEDLPLAAESSPSYTKN